MSYSISGGGDEDYVVSRLGSVFWSSILKKISVSSDNYLVRRDEVTK
jgi:hypothetical protein